MNIHHPSPLMPITLSILPPDENVPEDTPEALRHRPCLLTAFDAKRLDGAEFFVAWGIGKIKDGAVKNLTTVANAATARACANAERKWGDINNRAWFIAVLEVKRKKKAWERVREALNNASDRCMLFVCCADDEVIDECCITRIIDDPSIMLNLHLPEARQ